MPKQLVDHMNTGEMPTARHVVHAQRRRARRRNGGTQAACRRGSVRVRASSAARGAACVQVW